LLATKDGVTVAREITLPNHVQNLGAETLKQACIRVNEEVGDGTTTAALLSGAILEEGRKAIVARVDPLRVAAGIQAAGKAAIETILQCSKPVTNQQDLEQVAFIASNGDREIARHMAEACMAVGKDGAVVIEDGRGVESVLTFKEGMEINQGALSPSFLTEGDRVIEGPLVAVVANVLSSMADVQDLMEVASQWPQNELVVFAPDVVGEALATMSLNNSQEVVKCIAVRAPGGAGGRQEDYLKDIAALAGADYVDPVAGYDAKAWDAEWFGSFRQATIGLKTTVLVAYEESASSVEQRLAEIRGQELHCTSDYDRDRLRERKAKLTGGLALLEVGGVTEGAMKERRARVEDALGAVQAALRSGVVPGGGAVYLRASAVLSTPPDAVDGGFRAGWRVCEQALQRPIEVLARNAGKRHGGVVAEKVLAAENPGVGWDSLRDEIRDLTVEPLVVDPTAVAISVVETACSVASTLLTAGATITSIEKDA
jgi:chaperonin GroEL